MGPVTKGKGQQCFRWFYIELGVGKSKQEKQAHKMCSLYLAALVDCLCVVCSLLWSRRRNNMRKTDKHISHSLTNFSCILISSYCSSSPVHTNTTVVTASPSFQNNLADPIPARLFVLTPLWWSQSGAKTNAKQQTTERTQQNKTVSWMCSRRATQSLTLPLEGAVGAQKRKLSSALAD